MFIKFFDEATALKFKERGFSYTIETINKKQKLYCFEATQEFLDIFTEQFCSNPNIEYISESKLRF